MIEEKYIGKNEIPLMEGKGVWGNIYYDEKFISITEDTVDGIYDYYLISNYGKIYHKYKGELIKQYQIHTDNLPNQYYLTVNIKTIYGYKSLWVHRLVLSCFYPNMIPTVKMDINHKDGCGYNNYISYNDFTRGNLEWMTRSENISHAYENGFRGVGENHHGTKISEDIALKVIELLQNNYTSNQIVDMINDPNLSISVVNDIRSKHGWKYLTKDIEFNRRVNRLFTEQDIHNFCKYFESCDKNSSINDICRAALSFYGFDTSDRLVETLRKVYRKKYYKAIVSQYNF